jgi:hypothetical protein
MRRLVGLTAFLLAAIGATVLGPIARAQSGTFSATPVIDWSTEARRAIVPAGPGGIFGSENYGNKFPGEAAVYMGIVHVAIYDAAVAIEGGYEPYAIALTAPPGTSSEAAIATAAHDVLIGLQPALGLTADQQAILDGDYASYLAAIPDGDAKTNGIAIVGGSPRPWLRCARTTAGRPTPRLTISTHPRKDQASGRRISRDRSSVFACQGSGRSL